jgi:hypothetical protein
MYVCVGGGNECVYVSVGFVKYGIVYVWDLKYIGLCGVFVKRGGCMCGVFNVCVCIFGVCNAWCVFWVDL